MAFGVFIHRSDSIYDDSPAERYQFPRQYLNRVRDCIGDWIVYYEPTKATDARGYFAIARVQDVIPDPSADQMYLAIIEPGSYLDFADPVAFKGPGGYVEQGILNLEGNISGRAQSAVRPLSREDFVRIVGLGLAEDGSSLPRSDSPAGELTEPPQAPFVFDEARTHATSLVTRPIRDRNFRKAVLNAYDQRCAMTGLKLINGGGRAEVEAAHIRPVASNGPDSVSNGLALCGTAHWMFDRGLISLENDLKILISRQVNDPEGVQKLINQSGYLNPPLRAADHPHPHFLSWHRDNCFKH